MALITKTGNMNVKVSRSEIGESQTGTPYVFISFVDSAGDNISAYLYVSEKALKNTVETLRKVFGFDGNFETIESQIQDKECSITVESEEFNGKNVLKVKWINPVRVEMADKGAFLKALSSKAARIPLKTGTTAAKPAPKPIAKTGAEPEPF